MVTKEIREFHYLFFSSPLTIRKPFLRESTIIYPKVFMDQLNEPKQQISKT